MGEFANEVDETIDASDYIVDFEVILQILSLFISNTVEVKFLLPSTISNQAIFILFSKNITINYEYTTGVPPYLRLSLQRGYQYHITGFTNSQRLVDKHEIAKILCKHNLSDQQIDNFMNSKQCINAAKLAGDITAIKKAYRSIKTMNKTGPGTMI